MKIDKKIIKELSDYLDEFNLTELEYTEKDTKIKVSKNNISINNQTNQTLCRDIWVSDPGTGPTGFVSKFCAIWWYSFVRDPDMDPDPTKLDFGTPLLKTKLQGMSEFCWVS